MVRSSSTVEPRSRPEHHEEHHPGAARPVGVALLHGHGVGDLGDLPENGVDLARADPEAVDVEDAVGAAVQSRRTVGIELDEVAVRPHARVVGEVGRVEAGAVGVAQEADGPGGEGTTADQLAHRADHLAAVLVDRGHVEAEAAGLAATRADGQFGGAEDEAADDVGAPGDRLEGDGADGVGDPAELPVVQHGAGGEHGPQP